VVFKGRLKKSAENLQIMQERERSVFGLLTGTDRIAGRKTGVHKTKMRKIKTGLQGTLFVITQCRERLKTKWRIQRK
jgi:hypothetical protein